MLHSKVRHEVGLAAVTGALVVSWFGAGLPALQASQASVSAATSIYTSFESDTDHDGITDGADVCPYDYHQNCGA